LSDNEVLRQFILVMGAGFANIARSRATTPITLFADRNAGLAIAILYKLAMPDEEGDACCRW
jgi:hypothetical protein